jgi:HAE1 family hydrophobic/amphiphilic exporter-1
MSSTCLAVLFVPAFFVVVRRFEEWRAARKSGVARVAAVE